MDIFRALKTRTKEEVAEWARDNFNTRAIDNICEDEVAREIRALTIRVSMYMEMLSDSQRQATALAVISIMISACAVVVSLVIAVLK